MVLIFAFCTLNSSDVRAQSLSLSISPPLLEVMIKPGKSITQVFKLTNEGEPTLVTPRLLEYSENGVIENKDFIRDSWITFLPGEVAFNQPFLLRTGETRGLILRIHPDITISESNYYRVLLFETIPNSSTSSYSHASLQSKIGAILLLNVTSSGMVKKEAQITRFNLPTLFDSFEVLDTTIVVKNTGATYFRPIGEITLSGPIGKGTFKIQPNIWLAGQSRIIQTGEQLSSENASKSLLLPGFYIGKYELGISFTLDESVVKISDKRIFYAVPWKGTVVLLIIFLGMYILRKGRHKKGT